MNAPVNGGEADLTALLPKSYARKKLRSPVRPAWVSIVADFRAMMSTLPPTTQIRLLGQA